MAHPMSKPLRYYQREAIDATYAYWTNGGKGNPLIELPTGTGKSLVLGQFVYEAATYWPGTRILVLTHVKELIEQNYEEMLGLWPDCPAGIFSAGLNRRDHDAPVLFAGIQSVWNKVALIQWADLVFIDECHLVQPGANGRYRQFIADLKAINPHLKVIGLTATPYRLGQGLLTEGKDALFDKIVYQYSILQGVRDGYLSPLKSKAMGTHFDLSGVKTAKGDYVQAQLEAAVDQDEITQACVDEIMAYGADRRGWVIFASGKQHAEHIRDAVRARGVSCEMVLGDTETAARRTIIRRYKAREIRCLVSVGVLTTGFNAPHVDLIAMMRPTKSTSLYVQMVGRGTRMFQGKDDCLVLDFAGNVEEHGPVDRVQPRATGNGGGEAPTKTCPNCDSITFAGARECDDCGYEFPPPEPKIQATASTRAVMTTGDPEWVEVNMATYSKHQKPGKAPTLRVDYLCGLQRHREWVTLEAPGGFLREKAIRWWSQRSPGSRPPKNVDEALERKAELATPAAIAIVPRGKYTDVVDVKMP